MEDLRNDLADGAAALLASARERLERGERIGAELEAADVLVGQLVKLMPVEPFALSAGAPWGVRTHG